MTEDKTYWNYLKLRHLLSLQQGFVGDEGGISTDELHFIVVHQVFELWFKLVLRELRTVRDTLNQSLVTEEAIPKVVHSLRRVIEVFKHSLDTFTVLETMTPQEFLSFRSSLGTASGFQSVQMREIEIILGLSNDQRVKLGGNDVLGLLRQDLLASNDKKRWEEAEDYLNNPTIKDGLHLWLSRTPVHGTNANDDHYDQVVDSFLADYLEAYHSLQQDQREKLVTQDPAETTAIKQRFEKSKKALEIFVQALDIAEPDRSFRRRVRAGLLLVESYRELPLLAWPRALVDSLAELEQLLVLWRTRHARMVERMIGRRVGTGGSSGVDYLDQTTHYRVFSDLWTVRTLLLPKDRLPPIKNLDFYGFAVE